MMKRIPLVRPRPALLWLAALTLAACGDAATESASDTAADSTNSVDTTPDVMVADTSGTADTGPDTTPPADTQVGADTTTTAFTCPPPAPHGWTVGERADNLSFLDCDGDPVFFHDTCGAPATVIFNYYGW